MGAVTKYTTEIQRKIYWTTKMACETKEEERKSYFAGAMIRLVFENDIKGTENERKYER